VQDAAPRGQNQLIDFGIAQSQITGGNGDRPVGRVTGRLKCANKCAKTGCRNPFLHCTNPWFRQGKSTLIQQFTRFLFPIQSLWLEKPARGRQIPDSVVE
jgi:hypothetical protein